MIPSILNSLTPLQFLLVAIYVPSGLQKVFAPRIMKDLWPGLPRWFWRPAGLWEVVAAILVVNGRAILGCNLLYSFMGGVLLSIVHMRDKQGNTFLSGKGPLGMAGAVAPLIAAVTSTALVMSQDPRSINAASSWAALCGAVGMWFGLKIYEDPSPKKAP